MLKIYRHQNCCGSESYVGAIGCSGNWDGEERNGFPSWDVVSQCTNEDVEDDINMILSATSFLSFDLMQVCVVLLLQHLTLTKVFAWQNVTSVGISYELWIMASVGEGEISSLHIEFLKTFCICV
jgi:DNA relaxase NicK